MAGLEELKKKLEPLFDSENDPSFGMSMDPCDSYMVSVNLIGYFLSLFEKQNFKIECQVNHN